MKDIIKIFERECTEGVDEKIEALCQRINSFIKGKTVVRILCQGYDQWFSGTKGFYQTFAVLVHCRVKS